tara:strand:- start:68 stop:352 length:285 start_codon:yes stop_codon:yes gene_type:complete
MNFKDAEKLQEGAIVRQAWYPNSKTYAIVLSKKYVQEEHKAKLLGRKKKERYDVTVHWLGPTDMIPRKKWSDNHPNRVQVLQNWEIMVVSHSGS